MVAASASAQNGPCALGPTVCGRLAFESGVQAYEAGRFTHARSLFRKSLKVRSHPVILFNLALAELGLEDHDSGIAHLKQVLADTRSDGALRQRVEEQLRGAQAKAGELRLDPLLLGSARLRVNGRLPAQRGVFWVAPGRVSVSIELPGETPIVRRLQVRAGEKRELVVMEAPQYLATSARSHKVSADVALYGTLGLGAILLGTTVASAVSSERADTRTLVLGGATVAVGLGGVLLWMSRDTTGPMHEIAFYPNARELRWQVSF